MTADLVTRHQRQVLTSCARGPQSVLSSYLWQTSRFRSGEVCCGSGGTCLPAARLRRPGALEQLPPRRSDAWRLQLRSPPRPEFGGVLRVFSVAGEDRK